MTAIEAQRMQQLQLLCILLTLLGATFSCEAKATGAASARSVQLAHAAHQNLREAAQVAQASHQALRVEADRQFEQGQINRAIQLWSQLIIQGQDIAASLYNRAQAYLVLRQFSLAMADLDTLEKIQRPQVKPETYLLRGIAFNELHDFPQALHNFNLALGLNRNSMGFANRALAYQNHGRLDLAKADLQQAVLIEASPTNLYNLAAIQRQLGQAKPCLSNLNKAIELNPGFAPAYTLRGICHYWLGDHKLAITDFLRANTIDPNQPESYHYLGLALAALQRPKEANQFLLKAADLYLAQNNQILYQQVMRLLTKSGG